MRNGGCGIDARASIPRSAFPVPHFLAGAALVGLLATSAGAQQPDSLPKDTATLAPVVVTGARLPALGEIAGALTGRTATLSAADLDARGVESLADALEHLPGVTTSDELGAGAQLDVSLRGFSVSPVIGLPQGVTVYVDGVRANEPDAHQVNFDLLPLEDVQRVDVVYGPSVLLGRNSLGAAVNLVTQRGASPAVRELELSGWSFGRYEVKGKVGDRRGSWDYYAGARYEHEDGWREEMQSRIATLFAKVGLLNHTWDASLSYSGGDNRINQAGSLPESVYVADPRVNFTADFFAPRAHLVILNAQRLVLGGAQLAINGYGRALQSEQFNGNFVGDDTRQRTSTRQGGGAAQLSRTAHLGSHPLRLLGGVDGGYQNATVRIFIVPSGAPDSLSDAVRANEVDLGGFLGASLGVGTHVTVTGAARYDWIRVPFEDLLDDTQSGLNYFRRLSPRIGLTWTGGTGHQVLASVSRGFRSPALVEIGCADPTAACPLPFALGADPPLRPVVATTYDLGWHYRPHGRLDASANVYWTDVRDDIFFVASSVTGGYFQNVGVTRRAGVELAVQWTGRSGLRAYANYGYTRATFQTTATLATTRDTTGETVTPGDLLPLVPDHRVNAGIALPLVRTSGCCTPTLDVALDGRYVGRQWLRGDEANETTRLADYGVLDASMTARWRDLELRVMVRNLLAHRYTSFGTFAEDPSAPGKSVRFLTPGMPRSVQASVSVDF